MVPPDVLTSLNEAAAGVATIGALVFLIYLGIAAFRWMREACCTPIWLDSKGNEYRSEADADEADRRSK